MQVLHCTAVSVGRLDRVANNETELNGIPVPKGSVVIIPVYAIHMDPEIYPEPKKFDPER